MNPQSLFMATPRLQCQICKHTVVIDQSSVRSTQERCVPGKFVSEAKNFMTSSKFNFYHCRIELGNYELMCERWKEQEALLCVRASWRERKREGKKRGGGRRRLAVATLWRKLVVTVNEQAKGRHPTYRSLVLFVPCLWERS